MAVPTTYKGDVPASRTAGEAIASLSAYGRFWGLHPQEAVALADWLRDRRVGSVVNVSKDQYSGNMFGWIDEEYRQRFAAVMSQPRAERPAHIEALIRGLRTPGAPWVFGAAMSAFDENLELRKTVRPELYWFMAHHTWTVHTLPKGVVDTLIGELEKVQ